MAHATAESFVGGKARMLWTAFLSAVCVALAQPGFAQEPGPPTAGPPPGFGAPAGAGLFQKNCALSTPVENSS